MSKRFARDILLREKWSGVGLERLVIECISRGSPGDISRFEGGIITDLGRSFFTTEDGTMIPYHRIRRIFCGAEVLWIRPSSDGEIKDEE
ncbi:MAG: DUF504 domain-containing protein [Thermoplasmatota archaeon]